MRSLLRDIRQGLRSLRKSLGLTAIAVLTLGLGIGLTTTMYSVVYGTMLRGLPYRDGDRIASITRGNLARNIRNADLSIQDFVDFRAQQRSFVDLGAFLPGTIVVSGDEGAERFDGSSITSNLFDLVGVQPMLGRAFRRGEDAPSGANVVILSYSVWHDRYGADARIVGKTIRVNGAESSVVGVMPPGFAFPNNDKIWLPLQTDPMATNRSNGPFVQVVGKLRPGVSLAQANADVRTIANRLANEYKMSNEGFTAAVQGFVEQLLGPVRQFLLMMLAAVFFILLIASANVANILLDRAAHRSKEVAVRTALGASRGAIVRQFLVESALLSVGGAVVGVGIAYAGVVGFNRTFGSAMEAPFFVDIRLHIQVLLFDLGVAGLTTLLAGVLPAIRSSGADVNTVLKDETRGASSLRLGKISKAIVIFEIALSSVVLVAAGLMMKSVAKTTTMDPGYRTTDVYTARIGFPATYSDTLAKWRFFDDLIARIAALPAVRAVSISSGLPAARQGLGRTAFAVEGQQYLKDKDYPTTSRGSVTPGFFATLGIPLVKGRVFADADRQGSVPVVAVNRAFATLYFKNSDPIGRRIRLGNSRSTEPWLTVVGVVGNTFNGDQSDLAPPTVFQPFAQRPSSTVYIAARTAGPPLAIAPGVREIVSSLEPDIPLFWVQTLEDAIAPTLWFVRVFGTMLVIFGVAALFLASVGLYAVMAFSVNRRTREIGIRTALGARAIDVIRMVLTQGLTQLGLGIAIGLSAALVTSSALAFILFQVQPRDPIVLTIVALILLGVGMAACVIPARRAVRVDPLTALRSE